MGRKYKTKFPMARIKKIMQLDNEIGKVALATPILISKALEMFMQNLVDVACVRTRNVGASKLEAVHLRRCIIETAEFDFLKDAVGMGELSVSGSASGGALVGEPGADDGGAESPNRSKEITFIPYEHATLDDPVSGTSSEGTPKPAAGMAISSLLNETPSDPTSTGECNQ